MGIYLRAWLGAFSPRARRIAPLSPRRLLCLALFPLFIALQGLHWLFLALDHLLFPGFRRQLIERPVFVIGVPRSGTTFLHRELATDDTFTTTSTWELLFAPSLSQRYLAGALIRLDRLCGAPAGRTLRYLTRRVGRELNDIHAVEPDAAEEDYLALLPAAGCFFASLAFPDSRALRELGDLSSLPAGRRQRLIDHYHGLLQRHVFAHGGRRLLSKNAAFASWGEALVARYPDATILICIREPLDAVSSQLSALQLARAAFAIDPHGTELPRQFQAHYQCWFQQLEALASRAHALVIDQGWMAAHSEAALERVYAHLGQPRPGGASTAVAGASPHRHHPARFGLERDRLDGRLQAAYLSLSRRAALQR